MGSASAQSRFIQACEKPESAPVEYRHDIKWFKLLYKTEDCRGIAKKLSQVKGLSEIFLPSVDRNGRTVNSWTDQFPHLYGFRDSADVTSLFQNFFDKFTVNKVFNSLELYQEFENITDLPYSHDYPFSYKYTLCDIFKILPQIKSVSIDSELLTEEADQCLSSEDVDVIIRTPFQIEIPLKSRVIGIENYFGKFSDLAQFPDLLYLGISKAASNQGGLETLAGYNNITHLSINNKGISGIENLGNMVNLAYLSLNCIENEEFQPYQTCESGSYLTDTNFLKKLRWLRHLNLNYNNLKELADISNLTNLTTLELEGNKLKSLPDLGKLLKLRTLAVGGNLFTNFTDFTRIKNLEFLDLSSNLITDYSRLSQISRLVHLNLSNNPFLESLSALLPPKSLRVLSLNGGLTELKLMIGQEEIGEEFFLDDYTSYTTEYLDQIISTPLEWYEKTLKQDVLQDLTAAKPFIAPTADFSHLKNIEFLSLRNNRLKHFPDIQGMSQLKYLDLQGNLISKISPQVAHSGIVTLDMTDNLLTRVPDVSHFSSLKKLDLTANRIHSVRRLSLPPTIKNLALAHNQLKSLSPLSATKFKSLNLFLEQNPVKKNRFFCPLNSSNSDLTWFCDRLVNDRDNIEADCGDWCYEPEI